MRAAEVKPQIDIGDDLWDFQRVATPERLIWYGDGLLTSAAGKRTQVGSNIHTDEDYAHEQGLPAAIADGMLATNWISTALVRLFGEDYVVGGKLRTKYLKPTVVNARVRVRGRVRDRIELESGHVQYFIDVWTEDELGMKLTDGEAQIVVPVERIRTKPM